MYRVQPGLQRRYYPAAPADNQCRILSHTAPWTASLPDIRRTPLLSHAVSNPGSDCATISVIGFPSCLLMQKPLFSAYPTPLVLRNSSFPCHIHPAILFASRWLIYVLFFTVNFHPAVHHRSAGPIKIMFLHNFVSDNSSTPGFTVTSIQPQSCIVQIL